MEISHPVYPDSKQRLSDCQFATHGTYMQILEAIFRCSSPAAGEIPRSSFPLLTIFGETVGSPSRCKGLAFALTSLRISKLGNRGPEPAGWRLLG